MHYLRLLSIAGSDSGGGAGIQADLKTFAALGAYGMSVVTAVTAQNTERVYAVHEVPPDMVAAQLDAVLSDLGADAVKIGMLGTPAVAACVADRLRAHATARMVLDPVLAASSGDALSRGDLVSVIKSELIPLATLVTPNLPEAEVLLGRPLATDAAVREAAEELLGLGCRAVLIKGGHRDTPDCRDLLTERTAGGKVHHEIAGPRIATRNTHGTGCTLSSAIAVYLARGCEVLDAVRAARTYLTDALEAGACYQVGRGSGPLCHGFRPISAISADEAMMYRPPHGTVAPEAAKE